MKYDTNQDYDAAAAEANQDTATLVSETSDTSEANNQNPEDKSNQAPVWDGTQFSFEQNGQKIVPKDRNELLMWANRGRNYSQRAAELKQQQAEIERMKSEYGQYAQLAQAFEQNPAFKKQILDLYAKSQNNTASPQEEQQLANLPPEIQAKLAKIDKVDELESKFEKIQEEKEDQLLENEVNALKNKYKADWDTDDGEGTLIHKIMQKAIDTGLFLEDCYKLLNYDSIRTNTEAETKKALAEQQMQNQKKGIVSGAYSQKAAPQSVDVSKTSWNKLAEQAIAEMTK
jgi:hypothetical protein